MFSSLFSFRGNKNSVAKVDSRKSKKGEGPYNSLHSRKKSEMEGRGAEDVVLNDAERQLYRHAMAEEEQDFGDMLKLHTRGQAFPYASIIARPEENYDARVRRLQNMQPHVQSRKTDLPDYVNVKLFKSIEDFSLTEVFKVPTKGIKNSGYDYVCIKRVTMVFAPLSSFMDTHSDVIVSLMDMRKRTNNIARALKLQDNKNYRGEFALDYSFPKCSVDKISLSFAQEVPTFMVGEQWGACQMYFDIEESTFPISHAFQETIGTLGATESMLQEYSYNPAVKDLAVRDSHLKEMRSMYLDGDILDETEAMHDKTAKIAYASSSGAALSKQKSSLKKADVNQDGEIDWSKVMSQPERSVPQDQVSQNSFREDDEAETVDAALHRKQTLERYQKEQEELKQKVVNEVLSSTTESAPKTTRFAAAESVVSSNDSGEMPVNVGKFANLRLDQDH